MEISKGPRAVSRVGETQGVGVNAGRFGLVLSIVTERMPRVLRLGLRVYLGHNKRLNP